ncbi:MAG: FtsX-like permease family protein, partial [Acidobacteriaceae bacterium]|nr:FtsX-like permease family protein [Acidobacteriaceae bacterium]
GLNGAVISYAFWQREFGGDPAVIGKQISLDGHIAGIAGVTPANFFGVEIGRSFDVAVPVCAEPLINGENSHLGKRHHWWLAIIGRLKPGWTVERAAAQAAAISPAVFSTTVPSIYRPDQAKYYAAYKLTAKPAGSGVSSLRDEYEEPLLLLLGLAALVLLIACSNLANLMLARATNREREMAVRLAIGADRARLLRQLLIESLTLALTGALAGAFLARFLGKYLVSFLSTSDNPLFIELAPDWRLFAFTATLAILTCILFGLAPAVRATRTAPAAAMNSAGRSVTADRHRFRVRRLLVVSQVALSLVLLIGALLFVRSLRNLLTRDAGFRQDGLLIAGIDASRTGFSPGRRGILYRDILEDVHHIPGVQDAATASVIQVGGSYWNDNIEILGHRSGKNLIPWFDRISPNYFRTMGTPLIAGRDFDDRDTTASPDVAIVNEEFSRKFLGGRNPLGQKFRMLVGPGEPQHVYEIVGLVKNSKYTSLRDDFEPIVYVAASQDKEPGLGTNLVLRSNAPLGSLMHAVSRTLLQQNGSLSFEFQVFRTQLRDSLLRERLMATLSGFFGFLAGVLATVGLYGVISYMVARRRAEIGIRIALGANRTAIIKMILREAVLLLAAGLLIGGALAAATAQTARSLLYGLRPADPITILLGMAALTLIALAASLIPAMRASRVEPMTALRVE